jgi:hypothetical protein
MLHSKVHIPSFFSDLAGVAAYIALNFYFSLFVYIKLESPILIYKDKILKKIYAR